jgi:hypothetical protein
MLLPVVHKYDFPKLLARLVVRQGEQLGRATKRTSYKKLPSCWALMGSAAFGGQ